MDTFHKFCKKDPSQFCFWWCSLEELFFLLCWSRIIKIIREKNHVVVALHFPKVQILSFQAQHRAECPLHSRTDNNKHFVWREFWFNETFCHEVANPTKLLDFLPGSRRVKVSPELFWPSVTCHKLLLQIVNCFLWLLIERNDENLCLVQMQVWRDFSLIELTMWHRRWGSI